MSTYLRWATLGDGRASHVIRWEGLGRWGTVCSTATITIRGLEDITDHRGRPWQWLGAHPTAPLCRRCTTMLEREHAELVRVLSTL